MYGPLLRVPSLLSGGPRGASGLTPPVAPQPVPLPAPRVGGVRPQPPASLLRLLPRLVQPRARGGRGPAQTSPEPLRGKRAPFPCSLASLLSRARRRENRFPPAFFPGSALGTLKTGPRGILTHCDQSTFRGASLGPAVAFPAAGSRASRPARGADRRAGPGAGVHRGAPAGRRE